MAADGDSCEGAPEIATVHIRCTNGSKFSVQSALNATVGAFKAVVAGKCDVPADQQKLIYKGRILKDDQTLASYGVASDHTVHLVRGGAPSAASANTAGGNKPASRTSPSNSSSAFGSSLLPGLGVNGFASGGASGLFGTGFSEIDQMQQQLSQNPNMMREIMNMPAIQNLMNNPDIIRNFFMNNPQMREIIDRNPDLAHVLNDPSILRQTLEAARNPELMREMMRNTDRAMSNIESSPEGFNMLRRMYETVQEPFLNATTMGGDLGGDVGSNPFAALLGNQVAAHGRERSPNSTTSLEPTTDSVPNTNPLPNPWGANAGGTQPVNTRSNPASTPGIPGLSGFGSLDSENMVGRMQDPSLLSQVLQNPAMSQMMQNLLSDPQYVNQMLNFNPNVRSLLESNTQLREMLQNPDFLRQLMSPETMQQLLSFQQSLFSHIGQQQSSLQREQTGSGTGTPNNTGLDFLMNMFGGLGTGGLGVPNTSNVPPEELYATQLSQLQEMGFFDTQENIRALTATAGNVHAAVERLLGSPGN
ncbi:ubiquitin domain-containing protein DSK2a-like isoform X3 [Canna indica]|uniref:Ubiquitin domain-containing protein DSK2a-like isoform X3 n=1 Tax=Canna indica TaxID=4628 RepID=A0AAQ3KCD0_9LILI|nr:ubiquitin domain-containing protein DSK2a-like isoform X3 [Canna indica]